MGGGHSKDDFVPDKTAPTFAKETLPNYDEHKAEGPYWISDISGNKPIIYSEKGTFSKAGFTTTTVSKMFKQCKDLKGDKPAMRAERPLPKLDKDTGHAPPSLPLEKWKTWTWAQYYDESELAAAAMISLGLKRFQGVSIYGFNSPEWFMAEMAAILAGGVAAGIYPTDTQDQVVFKVKHSGAAVAVVETVNYLKSIGASLSELPQLKAVVVWDASDDDLAKATKEFTGIKILSWAALLELGKGEGLNEQLQARIHAQQPGECCALIYTSGTTGWPKAVMICHDNLMTQSEAVYGLLDFVDDEDQRIISYLPLSHVAGMLVDIIGPMNMTATRKGWCSSNFARPYDLKVGTIGERLRCIRPTMFLGVPRVWEKIAEKMQAMGAKTKGLKKKLAGWAKAKGLEYGINCQIGGSGKKPKNYGRAEKIVLKKIKAALGLSECKFGFTGAAPISKDTLSYFGSLGIRICELYGMSECTGTSTISTNTHHRWGSCGFPQPGVELKIFDEKGQECPRAEDGYSPSEASQGEICYRGRNIMMGYMANPDLGKEHVEELKKKNAEAIDENGWLHSGDKGCLDKMGLVYITGRYKELIIGAGGENIAPVPIENAVKAACPAISNIMMVGDKRKFNSALITLKAEGATGEFPGSNQLTGPALDVVSGITTITEASKSKEFVKAIENAIAKVNKTAPNNASCIQRFTILPRDFSTETDELTSTLKLKRSVVEKKYHAAIDAVYASTEKGAFVAFVGDTAPAGLDPDHDVIVKSRKRRSTQLEISDAEVAEGTEAVKQEEA